MLKERFPARLRPGLHCLLLFPRTEVCRSESNTGHRGIREQLSVLMANGTRLPGDPAE